MEGSDMKAIQVGEKVVVNGYPGTIIELCTGQLAGMVIVRLERGAVCVDMTELGD
jgi:hypothetical protein